MTWSGLYTPIITPFKDDQLDEEGLRTLVQFQKENHVDGLVLLGTTGEMSTLSLKEKERICKIVRHEASQLPLMIGTGTSATYSTIENTLWASDMGADAALVVTPSYNKPTQDGLLRHFDAVATASALPLFVYNNPGRTGVNVGIATLEKMIQFPTIVGIKESSKNLEQLCALVTRIKELRPGFTVLAGEDSILFPVMALGADGTISGTANLIPQHIHTLIHSCLRHNFLEARALYYELVPLFEVLSLESNPIPLKFAMHQRGLPAGNPRLPLTPLQASHHAKILDVLKKLHLLPQPTEA